MAFDLNNLIPIGGQSSRSKGPAIWSYTTADVETDINTSGYFNSAASRLAVGDIILTNVTSTGVPVAFAMMIVQSNTGSVVDVFNGINVDSILSDAD